MDGTLQGRASSARKTVRQDCREDDKSDGDVLSDIAKLVLWPELTAAHLAAAAKCSVRQAERFLAGHNWSGDAIAAVLNEILDRRRVRNLRVRAK